jgi:excisionase family DNA binding protein
MDEQKRWYTVVDLVNELQVHEQTVRRWIKSGELPAYALGDRAGYRVSAEDLRAFLEKRKVQGDASKKLAA